MFPPEIRTAIDAARARLTVTHDADQKTLRVDGMSFGAWMVFSYQGIRLEVADMAANVKYSTIITGLEVPSKWETNAAWEVAQAALARLMGYGGSHPEVLPSVHTLYTSRITVGVAAYLAMKNRVESWGGFTNERDHLPRLLAELSPQERRAVDDRLNGLVVT